MRHGRVALPALVAAGALVLPAVTAGGRSPTSAPGHGPGPGLEQPLPVFTPAALTERYALNRTEIDRAARSAEDLTAAGRIAALAAPGRRFLTFGGGRAAEVVGDLTRARRVAVLVPGADTGPETFDSRGTASPAGGARAVIAEASRIDPRSHLAVIAWQGYVPPRTLSLDVATTRRADQGARALRRLTEWLHAGVHGRAPVRISLLCHSYGSVVCSRAAARPRAVTDGVVTDGVATEDVTDIAVFGSPGMAVPSVRELHTTARIWAGRASGDWMAHVPKARVLGLGLGRDPVGRAFGARRFAAGHGGHSDYLRPGGISLHNLALIALGRDSEVSS